MCRWWGRVRYRDQIAREVLVALVTSPERRKGAVEVGLRCNLTINKVLARVAYEYADAMVEARCL